MDRLALSHPGKMGDALYALPTIKHICNYYDSQCDFYTSEHCRALTKLFEYQSYIDKLIIPPEYKVEAGSPGIQPWHMPIDSNLYKRVIQLGFRWPPNRPLHQFIANSVGIEIDLEIKYEFPDFETHDKPYFILAPRGETTYKDLFLEIIEKSPIDVVSIGGWGESISSSTIDMTGLDMLETLTWISKSKGFVGLASSQLALANGFNIPKAIPHDGIHWDMRHVVRAPENYYLVNPTAEQVLEVLFGGED